ncbi:hypothetical protein J2T12_000952 [Paenibacillus anaericanus]|uniref:S-layer homology domain-containing protein n=1 Tax=Paenibacillus anaericanus TaxID=170367 RepID=UPI00277EA30A|nr:S-layer homology domain-containing protein [Paenibacillus anaericanus]MDQ0087558.1 hypothetical protein [Paenibacillus anaericanus]
MVTRKFGKPYRQLKRWGPAVLAVFVLCNFVWSFTSWNVGHVAAAGSTSFTREVDPFPDVAAAQRITFGDYDADGDIDALVQESNVIGEGYKFVRANGDGTYTTIDQVGTYIPNSPFASSDLTGLNGTGGYFVPNIISLDYDSDGDTDIISRSGHMAGGANFILRNDSGTMVRITDPFPDVQVDTRIKFADMDLDGDIDALVQEGIEVGQGYIYVQRNADGTYTRLEQLGTSIPGSPFASADLTGLSGTMFIAVDFDGDGDEDIINRSGTNFILRNDNGTFTKIADVFASTAAGLRITFGDFDNDGDLDALQQDGNTVGYGYFYMQRESDGSYTRKNQSGDSIPDSPFSAVSLIGLNGTNMHTIDYDSDGDLDIISRSTSVTSGENFVLKSAGSPPTLLSSTPADNATGVGVNSDIVLNFSKNVTAGAGNIYIRKSFDDSVVETIAANSAKVTITGPAITINPDTTLSSNTDYYITFSLDAFVDSDSKGFGYLNGFIRAGIDSKSFLNFKTVNATAPLVVIEAGSSISPTSAILSGIVNDRGAETTVTFEYGLDTNYGTNVAATTGGSITAGTGNTTVAVTLTGLTPNTTYYYRVKAVNIVGTSYGVSQTFITAALTNAVEPNIDTQPANKTVNIGDPANLTVAATASDGGTLSYQWYSNSVNSNSGGTLIDTATTSTYNAPTTIEGTTYYYVVVTNVNNSVTGMKVASVTSAVAEVIVNTLTNAAPPSIDTQPTNKLVSLSDPVNLTTSATVSDGGTLSYQWYSNSVNSNSGGTLIDGATTSTYDAPTTIEGTTYYYVVVTNTNNSVTGVKIASATSNPATVTVNGLTNAAAPTISNQLVDQAVNIGGSVSLSIAATVSDGGTLSYQWYSNSVNSNSGGTLIDTATTSTYNAPTTTEGTTYYYVIVTNTNNSVTGIKVATLTSNTAKITVNAAGTTTPTQPSTPSGPSTPSVPTVPTVPEVTNTGIDILVNGEVVNMGKVTTSSRDDQTEVTVVLDHKKLEDILASKGQHAVVSIPVNTEDDVVIAELSGQILQILQDYQAVLEIITDRATYTLPAEQINISGLSDLFGQSVALQDITIQIEMAAPTSEMVKVVEDAAEQGKFTLVVPAIEFTVKATYGGTTVELSKFAAYIERTIAIPDGVDPNKITTGIVVDPNGTVRHVPTKIIVIDGKHYAKVSSLTNSTYAIIWNPLEFSDVASHWSKNAVNDMGSRMVINGTGNGMFSPDTEITRAEFAAIIVRGLGLKLEEGATSFSDVKSSSWYNSAIHTALSYRLIDGYNDGTFRPNDKITREQAMVIMARAMTITNLKEKLSSNSTEQLLSQFTDANNTSAWAKESFADSLQAGIVSGRNRTQLAPKAFITRAEVATLIQRLLQKSDLI